MEPLRPVKEWLHDFYCMTEDNSIRNIIGNVWNAEVGDAQEANRLVNLRLETHIMWVSGFMRKVE